MTDVEKYGVFALVFVGLVLSLTLVQGVWDDEDDPTAAADEQAARPVIIRSSADVVDGRILRPSSARAPQPRPTAVPVEPVVSYSVRSLTDGRGPFDWNEAPVPYEGRRSVSDAPALPDGTRVHVVGKGETLGDISKSYFGTTTRWRDFLTLNPGLDPKKLQVGQRIIVSAPAGSQVVAAAAGAKAASRSSPRSYVVRRGDTLGEIAQREMGSATRSHELFQANRDLLSSPDKLKVGMSLRIP